MTQRAGRMLLLVTLVIGWMSAADAQDPAGQNDMLSTLPTVPALVRTGPLSFAPLVRKVVPAVVNIAVTQDVEEDAPAPKARVPQARTPQSRIPQALRGTPFEKPFKDRMRKRPEQMLGAGSGFVIDPSGIIVTNNHVVENADRITVSFSDGTELPARLIGADELTDIAVIAVKPARPLAFVTWGDSRKVEVGDWILAAGNPFGLGSSVTAGIVSARSRDIGAGPFDDFLQLDAPINPGNSGGPSFNMSGEVVALNTAIVSPTGGSVGIGFGIPSEIVAPIVTQLRAKGHIDRGWLGITLEDQTDQDADQDQPDRTRSDKAELASARLAASGVSIVAVDHTGPALRAGLKAGDEIDRVNGDKVDNARSLLRLIAGTAPGSSIRLSVTRNGHILDVPVVVGHRPADDAG